MNGHPNQTRGGETCHQASANNFHKWRLTANPLCGMLLSTKWMAWFRIKNQPKTKEKCSLKSQHLQNTQMNRLSWVVMPSLNPP